MLDKSYFNGDRLADYLDMLEELKQILNPVPKSEVPNYIDLDHVNLEKSDIDSIVEAVGYDYLVPYCSNSKEVSRIDGVVRYQIPGDFTNSSVDRENAIKVDLDCITCGAVYDGLLTGDAIVESIGIVDRGYKNVPGNMKCDDGQAKLIVDAVLAVDDMTNKEIKENYKVLVIGSSSPGGVNSGTAYGCFPYFFSGEAHLFDPYEVSRTFELRSETNSVKYYCYSKEFRYKELSEGGKYHNYFDLIFDDSWVENIPRTLRDTSDLVSTCNNFSIKQFPWERDKDKRGNIYTQKFFTKGLEERRVSRDVKKHGEGDARYGKCAICLELNFRVRSILSNGFFSYLFRSHKINCIDSAMKRQIKFVNNVEWIEVEKFDIDLSNYKSIPVDAIDGTMVVNPFMEGKTKMRFVFSNKLYVPLEIYQDAYQVLVIENQSGLWGNERKEYKWFVNKIRGEQQIVAKVNLVDSGSGKNLTHINKKKEKRFVKNNRVKIK